MRLQLKIRRTTIALLCAVAASGCDSRDLLGPLQGRTVTPIPRSADAWGAQRLVGSYQLGVECGIPSTLFPGADVCGGTSARYPVASGPGDHVVTIRLSGTMHAECPAFGKYDFGPLGSPWRLEPQLYGNWQAIGYSVLTTLAYWHSETQYAMMRPTAVSADSSVVDYSMLVDGEGEIVMDRQQAFAGRDACRLMGEYAVQIFVQNPVKQTPTIKLACTPGGAITRGDAIACVVHASAATLDDSVRITSWSFGATPRIDGNTTSHEWSGPLVRGGMVLVRGTLLGANVSDSVAVTVAARTWPLLQAEAPAHDSLGGDTLRGDLPSIPLVLPPSADHPFGYVLGSLADSHMQRTRFPFLGRADSIVSGPNAGMFFVTRPLDRPFWLVHISRAFDHASTWFKQQSWGQAGGPASLEYCRKSEIDLLRRRAEIHEGLRSTPLSPSDVFQPRSNHYLFFKEWIAAHDPNNKLYESLTWRADSVAAMGYTNSDAYLGQVWADSVEGPQMRANRREIDSVAVNLVPVTCRAR